MNQMVFSNRQSADNLLKVLIDYNKDGEDGDYYNDIHIKQEDEYIVVEWVQVPYEHDYGGEFKFVDEDQRIVTEFQFPDNTYGYEFEKGDKEAMMEDWKKEHPDWNE